MFPSNTSNNSYNRNYDDPSFPFFSFDFENNPTISKQQPNSPFNFHHFPSNPIHDFHQNIFHEQTQNDFDLFQIQHQYSNDLHLPIDMEMDVSIKTKGDIKVPTNTTNKRSRTRKDRHSKIETARGMRDRRMRLSLQVAKRFFHLQDMLGFAKASKTVEWLLNQSKNQINQIEAAASSKSNVSSLSSPEEVVVNENHQEHKRKKPLSVIKTKNSRKIVHHPLAKELREKARERARERTREKRSRRSNQSEVEEAKGTIHNFSQLGSWNTQFGDESSGTQISQTLNPSCDFVTETNDLSSFSLSEEHLGTLNEEMMHIDHSSLPILSTSNTSMIFSSQNHS